MYIDIPKTFNSNIAIPYGQLGNVIDWCKVNCTHEWKYDYSPHDANVPDYVFYFESERDYVAFLLWNK
jgi:hypothetical protein